MKSSPFFNSSKERKRKKGRKKNPTSKNKNKRQAIVKKNPLSSNPSRDLSQARKKKKGAISWQKKRQFFKSKIGTIFSVRHHRQVALHFFDGLFSEVSPFSSTISTNGLNLYFSV